MTNLDPQGLASKQGMAFKDLAVQMVEGQGWEIAETRWNPWGDLWPEVDIVALETPQSLWWLQARGSWRGGRPGLIRTDTTRKLLAVMYDLHGRAQEAGAKQGIVTSHLPSGGSGKGMLDRAVKRKVVQAVFRVDLDVDKLMEELGTDQPSDRLT